MDIKNELIGDIVAKDFRTAAIFKKNQIDFCCRGGRTIEDACADKNINPQAIYDEIENLNIKQDNTIDFNAFPLDLLADYVEKTHHRYVEEKTPVLLTFLDKIRKVHGEHHPELFEVYELFEASSRDLAAHLKKEELILFPFIRKMIKAKISGEKLEQPHFGTVENPVNMMKEEHTVEGDRMRKIAELTNEFQPPADACNTYQVAFAMLQDFENDLHKHIHLENNILFPKSLQLEESFKN